MHNYFIQCWVVGSALVGMCVCTYWKSFCLLWLEFGGWMCSLPKFSSDTWLILPAVICSDKGLSHACLRTYAKTMNLRTAHYKSFFSFFCEAQFIFMAFSGDFEMSIVLLGILGTIFRRAFRSPPFLSLRYIYFAFLWARSFLSSLSFSFLCR